MNKIHWDLEFYFVIKSCDNDLSQFYLNNSQLLTYTENDVYQNNIHNDGVKNCDSDLYQIIKIRCHIL